MPALAGATEWLNATGAHAEAEAQGHPTLVHFWSLNCDTCTRNLRRIAAWRAARGAANGLRVIAIHTPHDAGEADAEQVRDAVTQFGLTEPCAMDNEGNLRAAFQLAANELPAYFLFDAAGSLRCYAAGADGADEIEAALDGLPPSRAA